MRGRGGEGGEGSSIIWHYSNEARNTTESQLVINQNCKWFELFFHTAIQTLEIRVGVGLEALVIGLIMTSETKPLSPLRYLSKINRHIEPNSLTFGTIICQNNW